MIILGKTTFDLELNDIVRIPNVIRSSNLAIGLDKAELYVLTERDKHHGRIIFPFRCDFNQIEYFSNEKDDNAFKIKTEIAVSLSKVIVRAVAADCHIVFSSIPKLQFDLAQIIEIFKKGKILSESKEKSDEIKCKILSIKENKIEGINSQNSESFSVQTDSICGYNYNNKLHLNSKINKEMPFPIFFSEINSPSHINKTVPAVTVIMAISH